MSKKTIGLIIAVIIIIAAIVIIQNPFREKAIVEDELVETGTGIGDLAPDFKLKTPQGEEIQLSTFRNKKPVILNFWATWCPPCEEELPFFQKEHEKNRVKFLEINLQENPDKVQEWFDERDFTMTILMDPNSDIKNLFGAFTQPVTIFIDKEGIIQDKKFGQILESEFNDKLNKIL